MSQSIERLWVELGERRYEITIGTGILARSGDAVARLGEVTRALVVTDVEVEALFASAVRDSFQAAGIPCDVLCVPAGEGSKSPQHAQRLWEQVCDLKADRNSVVVALGGGVVGDLAGFVAATYARGLRFVQIPTTLLAQVDSSVGGKVGVNLPRAKNMVGAFWQPRAVWIDTDVLKTLPDREYRAGLAEVVKYGVIFDEAFFASLEAQAVDINDRISDVLRPIIRRSCQLKAAVVEADEREETGQRAMLNYGHTFCHALETVTGYGQLLHGEAVSIGMMCAARLAQRLGRIDASLVVRQKALLTALHLPVTLLDIEPRILLDAMARDKKTVGGKLRFVLPSRLGHAELVDGVDEADILAILR